MKISQRVRNIFRGNIVSSDDMEELHEPHIIALSQNILSLNSGTSYGVDALYLHLWDGVGDTGAFYSQKQHISNRIQCPYCGQDNWSTNLCCQFCGGHFR